jgi:hypothetical protein
MYRGLNLEQCDLVNNHILSPSFLLVRSKSVCNSYLKQSYIKINLFLNLRSSFLICFGMSVFKVVSKNQLKTDFDNRLVTSHLVFVSLHNQSFPATSILLFHLVFVSCGGRLPKMKTSELYFAK